MSEKLPELEILPNWAQKFERNFGDVLTEAILEHHPGQDEDSDDIEKQFFYYKLSLLQALIDPSQPIMQPTVEMEDLLDEAPITEGEFIAFIAIAELVLRKAPEADGILTADIFQKCDEVLEEFPTYEPLFGAPASYEKH